MKPDYKLSDKICAIMEKENLTYGDVAKEADVSYGTAKDYAEKKPVSKWQDSKAVKLGAWVNKYEAQYREKVAKDKAAKLQEESEKNTQEARKLTVFKRAKVVHAVMSSNLLSEQEKEEYVSQFML